MGPSADATAMVVRLTVGALSGSLKRRMMPALSPTLTAPWGGVTDRTRGASVSVVAPV